MIKNQLDTLNEQQKKAVLHTDGPLLILAGAGSGKTKVLTHKIAYLIEQGVRPFSIIAITFTNKAAKEMKHRLESLTPFGKDVWVSTFHSTCVKILRVESSHIGFSNNFTIYDYEDTQKVIKEICKEFKVNTDLLPVKRIINEISRQKDNLISAKEYYQINHSDFKKKQLAEIYLEYENRLQNSNSFDFDDLIFKTILLFQNNPSILEKYQGRFNYIMVDEYQDTSKAQYNLIRMLVNKNQNICVVGDDDQSIYGWRGADISNILNFESDFPSSTTIKLEQNYRSTKVILNAANSVIANNYSRKGKSLWTSNLDGELISYHRVSSDREEASFISKTINELLHTYSLSDFAILYRENSLSRIIEEEFVKKSIKYKIFGGLNFYNRKEVKDILSYLKLIENPKDEMSLKRIINVPKRSIGEATISKVSQFASQNNLSFFEALSNINKIDGLGNKKKNLLSFFDSINYYIQISKTNPVSELINIIIEDTGYVDELEKEGTDEAKNRIVNLQELINKAVEFKELYPDSSLTEFLEDVSLVSDMDDNSDEQDFVTLMTLHSSKGLEFPVVFIIGFEEEIFPTFRALNDYSKSELEEERRLLYVGITRAKEKLFITSSKSRFRNGRLMNSFESSFLKEIPTQFLNILIPKEKTVEYKKRFNDAVNSYRPKQEYIPNMPSFSKEILTPKNLVLDFSEGDTVSHFKFKNGTVLKIDPAGADFEITVDFQTVGIKKVMAKFSNLKKI